MVLFFQLAMATPSTQIWNPSTDLQKGGTVHLGIDNYFSINGQSPAIALPTDTGLTYGIMDIAEVGADLFYPSTDPLYLNFKVALPENGFIPALAAGIMNMGLKKGTNYDLAYALAAKTLGDLGRFSGGFYTGSHLLYLDDKGNEANTGLILTWDKSVTDKLWACVDYASGNSMYGSLSYGISYLFAPNTGVIFALTTYNNPILTPQQTFTTQMDINL
jgi:hypothetical protein